MKTKTFFWQIRKYTKHKINLIDSILFNVAMFSLLSMSELIKKLNVCKLFQVFS